MKELRSLLTQNKNLFHPVVPFAPAKDKVMKFDFTDANRELTDHVINDLRLFMEYVNAQLLKGNARYGIGGYGEYRSLYRRSRVFDGNGPGEEPRRLHLGIDIWGKPNTAVMAPLDGIVHSFRFNDQPGDYGATIVLTHQISQVSFHTLYGHLSLNSIKNLHTGMRVEGGDIFADFGIPSENGHWPPHLHFQVIQDLQGWTGDYPGVCRESEKDQYLENCPDPEIILQMNRYLVKQ